MVYTSPNDNQEVTFKEYLCESKELISLMEKIDDEFRQYMELMMKVRTWHPFFFPKVSITEVNNENMGHIYLGKVRVPLNFNKRDASGTLQTKTITFVVCKYSEFGGDEYLEKRKEIAFNKAKIRLKNTFPERFANTWQGAKGCDEGEDYVSIVQNIARIDAFLKKHGLTTMAGK